MSFTGTLYGHNNARLLTHTKQRLPLGTRLITPNGNVYRYCKAGAVALIAGQLMQESVVASGHGSDLAVASAAAIEATTVTITNSTTAITADMYKEGSLYVNDVDGEGQICTIKSHPAESTGSGSCVITLEAEDALVVALTVSSQVGLRKHPYDSVIINPTTPTGIPVGVACRAIAASYYGWLQTWGLAAVLCNGTLLLGKTVVPGASTAGSVDVTPLNSSDTDGQAPVVGRVSRVAVSTDYALIFLTIAP